MHFKGFPHGKFEQLPIPPEFFTRWLPTIDHLGELKLTLWCFWALAQRSSNRPPYLRKLHLLQQPDLMASLGDDQVALEDALGRAVERGTLLTASVHLPLGRETFYFVNTPRGRDAVNRLRRGDWRPVPGELEVELLPPRPTIYETYEQNIGPLTAHIAEELRDAERDFGAEAVSQAIKQAVENNQRKWSYARAILVRWQQEGKRHETHQSLPTDPVEKYLGGIYADFIES
ncbi:MAG: DnaD domain protein [Anaerolineae bacterium]|nr:DnaD domain protein [Anaerolineae bacterium]MDW8171254.1 DnaD domain protein [Anaerolineae bacterium]